MWAPCANQKQFGGRESEHMGRIKAVDTHASGGETSSFASDSNVFVHQALLLVLVRMALHPGDSYRVRSSRESIIYTHG